MATTMASMAAREMTIGGVVARAFAAVGAAPALFFGTSFLLVALPSLALRLLTFGVVQTGVPGNPFAGIRWGLFATSGIGWWVLYFAAQAVLIRVTVAELDGRPEPVGAYIGGAARSLPALLGLSILLSLAVWFGMILLFVPGIILAMIWSVAAPALVAERIGVFASFGRSRRLTKGARWRIFGLVVLVFAIYWVASAVIGVGNIAASGLVRAAAVAATPSITTTLLAAVLQTAFIALWSAIQTTLYVELRDWKDGPAGDRLADIFA